MSDKMNTHAKSRILDTVVSMLREGVDVSEMTTREIAKLAEVNGAMINYYFQSKENLLNCAVDVCMGDVFNKMVNGDNEDTSVIDRAKNMTKAISDVAFSNYAIAKIALSSDIKGGAIDTLELLLPILKEAYSGERTELELKMLSCQIVVPLQIIFINAAYYEEFFGIDIHTAQCRHEMIDRMIDNILLPLESDGRSKDKY